MRELLRQYPEAVVIALVGHALLIAALVIGADFGRSPQTEEATPDVGETRETVDAVAVEPEAVDRAMERLEQQEREEEAERERLAQERREEEERLEELRAEQERAEQEREQAEQERQQAAQEELERAQREAEELRAQAEREAEEARAEAERERREAEEAAEQARQEAEEEAEQARREAEEAERQAEEERQRREEEERRQAELEAEQEAREQAEQEAREQAEQEAQEAAAREERQRELDRLGSQYKNAIEAHVEQNWRQPSAFEEGNRARVLVRQIPSGDVTDVSIEDCEGSRSFCESVEAAVRRASPLPEAPDDDVFSREIRFTFDPTG